MKPSKQITDTILMVRPANFGFNAETAANNAFQQAETGLAPEAIRESAIEEFDAMVQVLRQHGIRVEVVEDTDTPVRPDAIFPNNWVSFHADGTLITYPMYAPLRRLERRQDIVDAMSRHYGFTKHLHFEDHESVNRFLEGTGSMILDRDNQIVYACLSPRTDRKLLEEFAESVGYRPVSFRSVDLDGREVYHTNVMMALGVDFAVICLDSIPDQGEYDKVVGVLQETGKTIIPISLDQMNAFAGNMLQVSSEAGNTYLVMSDTAFQSLHEDQVKAIERHTNILHIPIPTIETIGGGSVRCMMAEVFAPK